MTHPLSVAIITRNEAPRIRATLESIAWAEEVIVVDAESTDDTVAIAKAYTPHVIVRPWPGYAAQKNFALARATRPWVLSLDADEQVTPELRDEIAAVITRDGALDGYFVARKNFFCGHWIRHGLWFPDYQLRLFRRDRGRFRAARVHETVEVEGRVGHLQHPLLHFTYDTIGAFIARADLYSSLAAQDRSGRRVSFADIVLRPLGRFLSMYVIHRGFLDGRDGLLLAMLSSYYVFLRSAKAWELQQTSASSDQPPRGARVASSAGTRLPSRGIADPDAR